MRTHTAHPDGDHTLCGIKVETLPAGTLLSLAVIAINPSLLNAPLCDECGRIAARDFPYED